MKANYLNPQTGRRGCVNEIVVRGRKQYCANYQDENFGFCGASTFERSFKDAETVMRKHGYQLVSISGEIKTKAVLSRVISDLTSAGYMFEIRNYYQGGKADRPGYMINVLGRKTD